LGIKWYHRKKGVVSIQTNLSKTKDKRQKDGARIINMAFASVRKAQAA
jgi:hypothetical protein